VKITRSVAYFGGADLLPPTMILVGWTVVALLALGFVKHRRKPPVAAQTAVVMTADRLRLASAGVPGGDPVA
jgi:hypothetical protein